MTSTDTPRRTRQRASVQAYLDQRADFQTAQQIHDHLRSQGTGISLPTVYRTLAVMAESGDVDQLVTDGQTAYRRCSRQHHHHLMCRSCGRTVELVGGPVEAWAASVAAHYGYTAIDHVTEVSGLCPSCQNQ